MRFLSLIEILKLFFKTQVALQRLAHQVEKLKRELFCRELALALWHASQILYIRNQMLLLEKGNYHKEVGSRAQVRLGLGLTGTSILFVVNHQDAVLTFQKLSLLHSNPPLDPQNHQNECSNLLYPLLFLTVCLYQLCNFDLMLPVL